MTEYDSICNKATARGWDCDPLSTPTAMYWDKRDLNIRVVFKNARIISAYLYRDGDVIDKVLSTTCTGSKLASVMYLLESV